jgi:hypothetical protein
VNNKDKTKPKPEPVIAVAIRDEMRKLLNEPLTPATITALEQFCESARSALLAYDPSHGLGRRRRRAIFGGVYSAGEPLEDEAQEGETFGARMMRELVTSLSALQQKQESTPDPVSFVIAIKHAKESGLDDMAKKLEQKFDSFFPDPKKEETPVLKKQLNGSGAVR